MIAIGPKIATRKKLIANPMISPLVIAFLDRQNRLSHMAYSLPGKYLIATAIVHMIGKTTWKTVTTEGSQFVVVVLAIVPMASGPSIATRKNEIASPMMALEVIPLSSLTSFLSFSNIVIKFHLACDSI